MNGLVGGADGLMRCAWGSSTPDYRRYHDHEWGRPVADDIRLFEKVCLEGFQSGLSWLTILRKRENFRAAFAGFDFHAVAGFGEADIERLMGDAGIVRHRGKIVSTVNNAHRAIEMVAEAGSLAAWFWQFEPGQADRPATLDHAALLAMPKTEVSTLISKQLKARGWSFVGPTTVYAFMQAMGLVDDHIEGCHCRVEIEKERRVFVRPAVKTPS